MAENSKIEWTDHTFNPWIGCTKVSQACKNCYAEALDKRWGRNNWGPNATRTKTSEANWKQPIKWNKQAEHQGKRMRVFCASLADVFEIPGNPVMAEMVQLARYELWEMIAETQSLDWLLLTKRPENIMELLPEEWHVRLPSNVWIGTTVEDQATANERIPHLLDIPAKVRFLSCEPMMGPIDLLAMSTPVGKGERPCLLDIHWVICGGESGHGARPMNPNWARSLRDQCALAGTPFLFKQWGDWIPNGFDTEDGAHSSYLRVGKKAAGRLLDGVEHNEFPI